MILANSCNHLIYQILIAIQHKKQILGLLIWRLHSYQKVGHVCTPWYCALLLVGHLNYLDFLVMLCVFSIDHYVSL